MSVAYMPTIITPRVVQLPSLTTGIPFQSFGQPAPTVARDPAHRTMKVPFMSVGWMSHWK
jgi:hypothetical protein